MRFAFAVGFVARENDGFARATQQFGDFVIECGRLFARIGHENDDVGFVDGELRLRDNRGRVAFLVVRIEAAGVDEAAGATPNVAVGVKAVARGSGKIFDDGDALSSEAIEKSAFANVGTPDNRDKWFRHETASLTRTANRSNEPQMNTDKRG